MKPYPAALLRLDMFSITVDGSRKYPYIRWPKELLAEGFNGTLQILNDSITAIVIHPAASLEQVKKSLELKIKDLELRIEKERVASGNGEK